MCKHWVRAILPEVNNLPFHPALSTLLLSVLFDLVNHKKWANCKTRFTILFHKSSLRQGFQVCRLWAISFLYTVPSTNTLLHFPCFDFTALLKIGCLEILSVTKISHDLFETLLFFCFICRKFFFLPVRPVCMACWMLRSDANASVEYSLYLELYLDPKNTSLFGSFLEGHFK